MMRALPARITSMTAPALLGCALVFGGASGAGFVANALLQLIALLAIILILSTGVLTELPPAAKLLLWTIGLAALMMGAQLLPLPPAVWERMPGHEPLSRLFDLLGVEAGWQPISLAREATIGSLLSLLPPTAMTLAIFASDEQARSRAVATLAAMALLSFALGVAQLLGGPHSPFYIYEVTNRGSAVGLFANRNHLATLLLCALPLLVRPIDPSHGRKDSRLLLPAATALLLGCGVVMVGSRAGLALLLPTFAMMLVLMLRAGNRRAWARPFALAAALPCLAALAFGAGLPEGSGAHARQVAAQHRPVIISTTLRAAGDYLPWGSGGGSFETIYPSYEDPEAASPEYVNHAHCDLAELALEYGVPGLLVSSLALLLGISRVRPAWRLEGAAGIQARAALVILAIVFLSSLVDYPMRTTAIACVAAMASALLVMPQPSGPRRVALTTVRESAGTSSTGAMDLFSVQVASDGRGQAAAYE